jgi:hypothetical protein
MTTQNQTTSPAAVVADLPLAALQMEVRNVTRVAESGTNQGNAPAARFELVFSTGAPVRRYDWANDRYYLEQLQVTSEAVNLERLQRGAPLLNNHSSYSLDDQVGVVDQPNISAGVGTVQAQLSRRDAVRGIVQDLEDRVIRNVSVGYIRDAITQMYDAATGGWTYLVTRWTPMEVSLVCIPADMDSQVRSVDGKLQTAEGQELRSFPCLVTRSTNASASPANPESPPAVGISAETSTRKDLSMFDTTGAGGTNAPATTSAEATAAAQTAATVAIQAATTRAADISALCSQHNVPNLAADLIRTGQTVDQARTAVLAEIAIRDAAAGGHRNVGRIETVRDEMQVRLAGIEQAILHRISPTTALDENGRQYRGLSLLEMGRDFLTAHGVQTRGMSRMEVAGSMLNYRAVGSMSTSDFSSLFANVANKRLRSAYDENAGTYGLWARRAPNAPDFKNMSVVQLAGAPDLLQTNESGEFKYGAMSDGAETYAVLTYGRIVSLTRQAIVNDDLRGFERLIAAFGFAARRLENRTVYSQLTTNANMADGVALFHASHGNLAAASPLDITKLGIARAAMRLQKGFQGEELNLAPSYLIVPVGLEQTSYNLTSANYVPSTKAEINEFRAGGRTAVTPIVEPVLDANNATTWYMAASSSQVDTVEYCYLDGAEGPVIESEVGFETDGVSYKCRLDFAAKAVDYRGIYKAVAV